MEHCRASGRTAVISWLDVPAVVVARLMVATAVVAALVPPATVVSGLTVLAAVIAGLLAGRENSVIAVPTMTGVPDLRVMRGEGSGIRCRPKGNRSYGSGSQREGDE